MAKDKIFLQKVAIIHAQFKNTFICILVQAFWVGVLILTGLLKSFFL